MLCSVYYYQLKNYSKQSIKINVNTKDSDSI